MDKAIKQVGDRTPEEKVLIAIVLKVGDWLVQKSSNKLDDKIWAEVSKALDVNA